MSFGFIKANTSIPLGLGELQLTANSRFGLTNPPSPNARSTSSGPWKQTRKYVNLLEAFQDGRLHFEDTPSTYLVGTYLSR